MVQTNDNSGMGVILGILIAVVLAVGGYFFVKKEGGLDGSKTTTTTTNIELPDVNIEPASGDKAPANPAE